VTCSSCSVRERDDAHLRVAGNDSFRGRNGDWLAFATRVDGSFDETVVEIFPKRALLSPLNSSKSFCKSLGFTGDILHDSDFIVSGLTLK
jgi:hypothetical protein